MKSFLLLLNVFLIQTLAAFGATVDTLTIFSQAMQKDMKAAVVVPDQYQQSNQSFPVLYLLHGGSGSYRDWLSKTPDTTLLHQLADQYNILIVTPDGGPRSYYFDSPLDKSSQYETHIAREVVATVDNAYRTVQDRKGRVIAGLSMGGHGAFFIATRHPDLFSAAGSMSGVMNINPVTWKVPEEFAQSRVDHFAQLLGSPEEGPYNYPDYTAVGMTDQMKANDVKLKFDCGVDDFLIETSRELHQLLLDKQIPHEYTERPGEHTWEYWENALPYHMLFFHKILKENGITVP